MNNSSNLFINDPSTTNKQNEAISLSIFMLHGASFECSKIIYMTWGKHYHGSLNIKD